LFDFFFHIFFVAIIVSNQWFTSLASGSSLTWPTSGFVARTCRHIIIIKLKKSGNPIGIKPNRNIFIPRLLEKYMPPIWPFGKKSSEHDSEVIIEYISPKGQIMRKKCIRVDCVNPVAIGNINYCSDSCKRADESEYVYSGGMSGNMNPL